MNHPMLNQHVSSIETLIWGQVSCQIYPCLPLWYTVIHDSTYTYRYYRVLLSMLYLFILI